MTPSNLPEENRSIGRIAGRLLIMRDDLAALARVLNEAYEEHSALECQQVLTALAAFSDNHRSNFERSVWPPRVDAEGDGLQWSDEDD